jgi:hypothetical protein
MNWKSMEGRWWSSISVDMSHLHCYLIHFIKEQGDGKALFEMVYYTPRIGMEYGIQSIANLKSYPHYIPMNMDLQDAVRSVFR